MFHQVPITVGWKETVLNVNLLDASIHDQQLESNPRHFDLQSNALAPWPRAFKCLYLNLFLINFQGH